MDVTNLQQQQQLVQKLEQRGGVRRSHGAASVSMHCLHAAVLEASLSASMCCTLHVRCTECRG